MPFGADDQDRAYFEPDPHRHCDGAPCTHDLLPELCTCTHQEDDHTHSDGGCAWHGCTCRWYEPMDVDSLEDWFEEGLYA